MNEVDEEKLIRIIERSGLAENLESVLKSTIRELCGYNSEHLKSIEQKILFAQQPAAIGEIVLALISGMERDQNKQSYFGLTEMKVIGTDGEIYFLDADYEHIREMIGDVDSDKIYTGIYQLDGNIHSFRYRLKFDNSYLKFQDLVAGFASIYPIENAVLYSPYIRKSVIVQQLDSIPDKVKADHIDYQFQQNGLSVIERANLLWNFRIESSDVKKASGRIPYKQNVKYKFHIDKSREGNWRYALPKNNQTIIYDVSFSEDGIDLILDRELEEFWIAEYQVIDWDNTEIKKMINAGRIHTNHAAKSILQNRRILSQGDIEFAIYPFRNSNGCKCEIADNLEKVCIRYSSKYRNHMKNRVKYPKAKQVKLRFSSETSSFFYDDYINFVLLYLEYYYPEIEWVGGW